MSKKKPYFDKDGNKIPATTQILKNLGWNTDALIGWARKLALQGIDPYKQRDSAADAGTLTHKYIEMWIKETLGHEELEQTKKELEELKSKAEFDWIIIAERGLQEFQTWCDINKFSLKETETKLVDEDNKYGLTIDCIAKDKNNQLGIIDFKTSKYVTAEHIIQLAAYFKGYSKLKEPLMWAKIVHIQKDLTKEVEQVIAPYDIPINKINTGWEVFIRLRQIHDARKVLEEGFDLYKKK